MTEVSNTAVIELIVETWLGDQRLCRALLPEGPPVGVTERGEIVSRPGASPARVWLAAQRGEVFAMSADAAHPAHLVDATRSSGPATLASTWTRVAGPWCVELGGVLVTTRALTRRVAATPPEAPPTPSPLDAEPEPPTKPGAPEVGPPSGATRLQPLRAPAATPARIVPTAPTAPTTSIAPTAPLVPTTPSAPPARAWQAPGPHSPHRARAPLGAAVLAPPPSRSRRFAAAWRGLSRTTRIVVIGITSLTLVLLVAPARGQRHAADGTKGEAPSDPRTDGRSGARSRAPAPSATVAAPSATIGSAAASTPNPAPPSPFAALGSPEGDADSPLAAPRDRAGERRVAEAMFAGDFARAAAEGRRLADANPESPEYPVVARVLRAKAARGGR